MAKSAFGMVASPDGGAEHMDEEEPSESMAEETDDGDEEEGDKAAARSAMSDFLAAIGVRPKDVDKALESFQELMEHC